jgi:hypothetical protein
MTICFAGLSDVTSLREMDSILNGENINSYYLENDYYYAKSLEKEIIMNVNNISISFLDDYDIDIFIPCDEYWLTKYSNLSSAEKVHISQQAIRASRSKWYLSDILLKNNVNTIKRWKSIYDMADIDNTEKIIIRPDTGYSSHGVTVTTMATYEEDIGHYNDELNQERKRILGITSTEMIFERFIDGAEYCMDAFVCKGTVNIVRIFRKAIRWINGFPFIVGYKPIAVPEKYTNSIKTWINILFDKNDISFAQFDFIVDNEQQIFPIDFSCRLGGSIKHLMALSFSNNQYANAILNGFKQIEKTYNLTAEYAQYNIITTKKGYIYSIKFNQNLPCIQTFNNKETGDFLNGDWGTTNSRVAEVIRSIDSEETFFEYIDASYAQIELNDLPPKTGKERQKDYLIAIKKIAELNLDVNGILCSLQDIKTIEDIHQLNHDQNHIAWNWLPAITYNVFGYNAYKEYRPHFKITTTVLMVNHLFLKYFDRILRDIPKNLKINEIFDVMIEPSVIASIYGGFPWSETTYSMYRDFDLFHKNTKCIILSAIDECDIVACISTFKNNSRSQYGEPIKKLYANKEFTNGILNPFHTPNHIECVQHLKQIYAHRV